jgi:hypothetical protein
MRQLVGLSCVVCAERIGSVIDGQFCSACGCPVHATCAKPNPDAAREAKCPNCGASAERAEQERRLHAQNAEERKGFVTSEQAERDGAPQPLISPSLKWGIGAIGFGIMSISALFSTLRPRPDNRLLNAAPVLGFDIFLPIGVLGIGFCLYKLVTSR